MTHNTLKKRLDRIEAQRSQPPAAVLVCWCDGLRRGQHAADCPAAGAPVAVVVRWQDADD